MRTIGCGRRLAGRRCDDRTHRRTARCGRAADAGSLASRYVWLGGDTVRPTKQLHDLGQSLWLDNVTRELLDSGTLQRYIDELSVTGLTSNPTIFNNVFKKSTKLRRRHFPCGAIGDIAAGVGPRAGARGPDPRSRPVQARLHPDRRRRRMGVAGGIAVACCTTATLCSQRRATSTSAVKRDNLFIKDSWHR